MTTAELIHMPAAGAFICADCRSVGNDAMVCPACAGTHLQNLANLLDREPEAETDGTNA